jgi:hypothetical protein
MRGSVMLIPAMLLLVLLCAAAPAGAAGYEDGAFALELTDIGAKGWLLPWPQGSVLPQVTRGDFTAPSGLGGMENHSAIGMTCDIRLSFGEIMFQDITGVVRMSGYMVWNDPEWREFFYLYGTFDLAFPVEGTPWISYPVSGLVYGDQDTMYMIGTDTRNTAEMADDRLFVIRTIGRFDNMSYDNVVAGKARLLWAGEAAGTVSDAFATARTQAFTALPLNILLPAGTTFNQLSPVDGVGDVVLDADTDADYEAGLRHSGTFLGSGSGPAPGSFDLTWDSFVLADGTYAGIGLSFGRYVWKGTKGGYSAGFLIGDIAPATPAGIPVEGYIISSTQGGPTAEFLFGTYTGLFTGSGKAAFAGTVEAKVYQPDSPPPVVFAGAVDPPLGGIFGYVRTSARDMNGWSDLNRLYVSFGAGRNDRRMTARYDVARNRFFLFDPGLGGWIGGCRPGESRVIRTPWLALNCGKATAGPVSSVTSTGELVLLDWALRPAARMAGAGWKVYSRAIDRSGLDDGWRPVSDDLTIAAP